MLGEVIPRGDNSSMPDFIVQLIVHGLAVPSPINH